MRRITYAGVCMLMMLAVLSGCTQAPEKTILKEKPVEILSLTLETFPEELNYFGIVQPKTVRELAFTQGGTLMDVFVEQGERIEAGTILASLDPENYDIALDTSAQQVRVAQLDYGKALKSYEHFEELYQDMLRLYEAGAVSKSQLDEAELGYEIAGRELSQADSLYRQALLSADYSENQLSDTHLIAETEGVVVDILNDPGEVVGAGYPVVIVRGQEQIVEIGMSSEDIKKIAPKMKATVVVGDASFEGVITRIHAIPDSTTRTYTVDISVMTEELLLIGDMAKVYVEVAQVEGVWLRISDILNDGEDYVYLVESSKAVRRNIEILDISRERVRVEGLEPGEHLIVRGSQSVYDGYAVKVVGGDNE